MIQENGHLIYKITNKINGKAYIGQTKEYYSSQKFGLEGRWKVHVRNALSDSKESKYFYRAIRKYGKDSFTTEILLKCDIEDVDDYEEKMIQQYVSSNRLFGYNVTLGGKGRKVTDVDENTRKKISSRCSNIDCKEPTDILLNIHPYYRQDKHIGYSVKRVHNKVAYCKRFSNTKYTVEENLNKAKEYLHLLTTNKIDEYKTDKTLPKHITYKKIKGEICGYVTLIIKGDKRWEKCFTTKYKTMDEKYKMALDYKEFLLNTYVKIDSTSVKTE